MHSISSIHTYPRGSLIPETCSNGTLGRKQLKDSCEIRESNGNEVENVQYNQYFFFLMEDFRFLIQGNCFHLKEEKENVKTVYNNTLKEIKNHTKSRTHNNSGSKF